MSYSRVRSRINNPVTLTSQYYDNPPGTWSLVSNHGVMNSGEERIEDNNHTDYTRRRARGEVIMDGVLIDELQQAAGHSTVTAVGPPVWGQRTFTGRYSAWLKQDPEEPFQLSVDVANATNDSINRAYAKAYTAHAAILVSIGEAQKTANMILKPLKGARSQLDRIITRKYHLIKNGYSYVQAQAQAWLEFRNGWKPLVFEIHNTMKATAEAMALEGRRTTARVMHRASNTVSREASTSVTLGGGPGYNSAQVDTRKIWTYKVTAGVLADHHMLAPDKLQAGYQVLDMYGASLRNFASAGWELLTLSYVVDRFVNVQAWLDAMSGNPYVEILGSHSSQVRHAFVNSQVTRLNVATTPPCFAGPCAPYQAHRRTLTRTVGVSPSTIPVPNPRGLSLEQHADHVSLLLAGFDRFAKNDRFVRSK